MKNDGNATGALTALQLTAQMLEPIPQYPFVRAYSTPIFTPKKHTRQTYGAQQRAAKRRRKSKNK